MVLNGLGNVFRTMLGGQIELEACRCLKNSNGEDFSSLLNTEEPLVVGNVGFTGGISGMFYLAMPESLAKNMTATMLSQDPDQLDSHSEMINDAVGELTNMSAGACKNQFSDLGYTCRLTIPFIIKGKYFVVDAAEAVYRQVYLLKYQGKRLTLELIMRMSSMSSATN